MNKYCLIVRYILLNTLFYVSFIHASHALNDDLEQHSPVVMTPFQHTPEDLDEDDFVVISRGNEMPNVAPSHQTQNFEDQEIDREVKQLLTQGGASMLSGALGFFGSGVLFQTGLSYVGYKIGAHLLPPVLNEVSLPVRYAYPFYRARGYVYQKGSDGLSYLYANALPPLIEGVKKLIPLPPPQEIEMDVFPPTEN